MPVRVAIAVPRRIWLALMGPRLRYLPRQRQRVALAPDAAAYAAQPRAAGTVPRRDAVRLDEAKAPVDEHVVAAVELLRGDLVVGVADLPELDVAAGAGRDEQRRLRLVVGLRLAAPHAARRVVDALGGVAAVVILGVPQRHVAHGVAFGVVRVGDHVELAGVQVPEAQEAVGGGGHDALEARDEDDRLHGGALLARLVELHGVGDLVASVLLLGRLLLRDTLELRVHRRHEGVTRAPPAEVRAGPTQAAAPSRLHLLLRLIEKVRHHGGLCLAHHEPRRLRRRRLTADTRRLRRKGLEGLRRFSVAVTEGHLLLQRSPLRRGLGRLERAADGGLVPAERRDRRPRRIAAAEPFGRDGRRRSEGGLLRSAPFRLGLGHGGLDDVQERLAHARLAEALGEVLQLLGHERRPHERFPFL
mmetsp:Transcript_13796/g.40888  ORF Transcript_13796/g.40888 Transcript_13796/m.40888 type:complete len:417 (-) Transcript_13796:1708-2958(-)